MAEMRAARFARRDDEQLGDLQLQGVGGGQMFGAEDDVGGSVGGTTGSACVRQWYVSSGGGLGAGAMSGVGTTG